MQWPRFQIFRLGSFKEWVLEYMIKMTVQGPINMRSRLALVRKSRHPSFLLNSVAYWPTSSSHLMHGLLLFLFAQRVLKISRNLMLQRCYRRPNYHVTVVPSAYHQTEEGGKQNEDPLGISKRLKGKTAHPQSWRKENACAPNTIVGNWNEMKVENGPRS